MAYEGSVDLISGIRAKNNGTFPLVNAPDVRIDDNTRLSDFVQSISDKTGNANGFATLDQNGKVPSSQLPSYVDDVLEYDSQSGFPSTGETGKIYVDKSTNKSYRWGGSQYIVIASDLALGETSSTAYRGDRGKVAYDHATAKGAAYSSGFYKITTNAEGHVISASAVQKSDITGFNLNKSDVGLSNVDNTADIDKPVSTATQTELDKKVYKTIKVNGHALSSDVTVTKSDVGLGNVDNTADTDKPVSTAQQTALDLKADKASPVFTGSISLGRKSDTTVGSTSVAIGVSAEASGQVSFAIGMNTTASGSCSQAEGSRTLARGYCSHAEGFGTDAYHAFSHVVGQYNITDLTVSLDKETRGSYVEIVGNGTGSSNCSNARTLDWNGNERLKGTLYVNGVNADATGGEEVATKNYVEDLFSGSSTQDLLQFKFIPGTVQSVSYDSNTNHISQILHTNQNGNEVIRTDAFSFTSNAITEVRTLNTGESLTIIFDSQNMTTTATYASA